MSNPPGRPRLYKTPEEFDRKVEEYNDYCLANEEPVTWTGLALFLGFACRASIDEYAKYDGFSYSVKRAKALVEYAYEKRLHGDKPTGAIFALKNFGWADKHDVDLSSSDGTMTPKHALDPSKLSDAALQELMNARNSSGDK